MKILVDTHYLIWMFVAPEKISQTIRDILTSVEHQVFYSPISLWEIAIKYNLGKLSLVGMSPNEFYLEIEKSFLKPLMPTAQEFASFYLLPIKHKDPFDRLLIWQCIQQKDVWFLSVDGAIQQYTQEGLKVLTK